ncbi:MAG: cell division protein FtsL [Gammaproteobacteria bacterium]|jgi:cell division protein FtsL|nr:cell division protein FtsL [Gammaproteobacteria bacterium]
MGKPRRKVSARGRDSKLAQAHTDALGQLTWVNAALLGLIMLSAFTVIYSTHACRTLYAQLQVLESSQWYLQEDYGRLMLEQSTWASHHRVESVARSDLGMTAPDLQNFKVVGP